MAVDPLLDFSLDSKQVDRPNRKAQVSGTIYLLGVPKATFTLTIDAKDSSREVPDFGFGLQVTPVL